MPGLSDTVENLQSATGNYNKMMYMGHVGSSSLVRSRRGANGGGARSERDEALRIFTGHGDNIINEVLLCLLASLVAVALQDIDAHLQYFRRDIAAADLRLLFSNPSTKTTTFTSPRLAPHVSSLVHPPSAHQSTSLTPPSCQAAAPPASLPRSYTPASTTTSTHYGYSPTAPARGCAP